MTGLAFDKVNEVIHAKEKEIENHSKNIRLAREGMSYVEAQIQKNKWNKDA